MTKEFTCFFVCKQLLFLCGVGKISLLHRYSVDIFSYSSPSGILGSDGKQNTS